MHTDVVSREIRLAYKFLSTVAPPAHVVLSAHRRVDEHVLVVVVLAGKALFRAKLTEVCSVGRVSVPAIASLLAIYRCHREPGDRVSSAWALHASI